MHGNVIQQCKDINKLIHEKAAEIQQIDSQCEMLLKEMESKQAKFEKEVNSKDSTRKKRKRPIRKTSQRKRRKGNGNAHQQSEIQQIIDFLQNKHEEHSELSNKKLKIIEKIDDMLKQGIDNLDDCLADLSGEIRRSALAIPYEQADENFMSSLSETDWNLKEMKKKHGDKYNLLEKEDIVVLLTGLGRHNDRELLIWEKKLQHLKKKRKKSSLPENYQLSLGDLLSPPKVDDEDEYPPDKTWCFCKQKARGQMICCDNDQCKIEWFHFDCVRLQMKPSGRWYCQRCRSLTDNLFWSSEIT